MNKFYVLLAAVLLICMLTVPLLADGAAFPDPENLGISATPPENKPTDSDTIRLYRKQEDTVITLSAEEYVIGVVGAEMPADFHEEALKAQAVAAYTVACHRRLEQEDGKDSSLKGADLSDDSSRDQGYLSKEVLKEKWGDNYSKNYQKIQQAVQAVQGEYIAWEGTPILAAYHAISGGRTESSEIVWGIEYPYLQPVESVGDLLATGYLSTVTVSEETFQKQADEWGIKLSENPEKWIGESKVSESGTVTALAIGDQTFDGQKIRTAFSLRSANFDVKYDKETKKFIFTVRGYGHAVGMSQYGADFMAQQGSDYREILQWYYTGCDIESAKNP